MSIMRHNRRKVSKSTISVKLYHDNKLEVEKIVAEARALGEQADYSMLIRQLVSEALFARRLQAHGKDSTTIKVMDAQKSVMKIGTEPLLIAIEDMTKTVEQLMLVNRKDYSTIADHLEVMRDTSLAQTKVLKQIVDALNRNTPGTAS